MHDSFRPAIVGGFVYLGERGRFNCTVHIFLYSLFFYEIVPMHAHSTTLIQSNLFSVVLHFTYSFMNQKGKTDLYIRDIRYRPQGLMKQPNKYSLIDAILTETGLIF